MKDLNVVFCVNNAYVMQLIVTMTSLLENISPNIYIHLFILTSDFSSDSKIQISRLHKKYKNLDVKYLSPNIGMFQNLKLNIKYISRETYFRYIIPDLLPDNIDKCLYLDADVIINGDIMPLYNVDLGDNYIAGVSDSYIYNDFKSHLAKLKINSPYINAGVLLMNCKKWRSDKISKQLLSNTIKYRDIIEFQDQDIINLTLQEKIVIVDGKYNFCLYDMHHKPQERKSAVIIHYVGQKKPWMPKCKSRHNMTNVWLKYNKIAKRILRRRIKIGLLIDEFFGGGGTAFGGYGMLARNYIAKYIPCADVKIDVLLGSGGHRFKPRKYLVDNTILYRLPRRNFASRLFLWLKNYDVYLSIELTTNYVLQHEPRKNKRLILWIQDPRPQYEWNEINTVKLFTETNYYNQQIYNTVHDLYYEGRIKFISQAEFLNRKAIDLYQLPKDVDIQYLPNPVHINPDFDVATAKKQNMIIFLGRIESVKRGWLFAEIARKMPEYDFYMLGQSFRERDKNQSIMSKYNNIPNLHFVGHVDGSEKEYYLKNAKILVNTSIHEALPVSFLEALAYGCILVSNRNPNNLTSKFGIWTGDVLGDGFDKINLYVQAIKELMLKETTRKKLAIAAREYIEQIHNIPTFVHEMRNVIYQEVNK